MTELALTFYKDDQHTADELGWTPLDEDWMPELKARKTRDDKVDDGALWEQSLTVSDRFMADFVVPKAPKIPVVHMARPLFGPHDGRHSAPGIDIIAFKRAVWRMGQFAGPAVTFDDKFNDKLETTVKRIQKRAGIPVTGNIGWPTFDYVRHAKADAIHGGGFSFDSLAIHLADQAWQARQLTPTQRVQNVGLNAALYWVAHKDQSSYAQVRPMTMGKPPYIPRRMDCSWFVTIDHFAAGAPDPNGLYYNGQGYTGTLLTHCRRVSIHEIQLLDLVFYGFTTRPSPAFPYGSPTHVALYVGGGYVASDGSNSGPEKRSINYRPINAIARNRLVLD